MAFKPLCVLLAGLFVAATQPAANAVVMTFDSLPSPGSLAPTYSENGIEATANNGILAYENTMGQLHLDDGGTSNAQAVTFALQGGGPFTAVSFDLIPYSINANPYDNVMVVGRNSGGVVASDSFFMGSGPNTHSFDTALFTGLTSLVISAEYLLDCGPPPCAHFDIDNLTLSPIIVPLPPALLLVLSALGAVAAVRGTRAAA